MYFIALDADDKTALFASTDDPDCRGLSAILRQARRGLDDRPRMDLPDGQSIARERDFGVTFGTRSTWTVCRAAHNGYNNRSWELH